MGPRPAGPGEMGAVWGAGVVDRGIDAGLRTRGEQRLLGGCLAGLVGWGARPLAGHQAAGNLPGQWPGGLGPAEAILEADGAGRGLVGVGPPAGVLSTLPQQVQPDRAVLVGSGEEVERGAAE